jgi:DNA-binding PadR family transcriptional regulator
VVRATLTELEACVLGLVLTEGPCTPYAVFSILRDSPSSQWSGSAGAIYPLFRRLEASGLLASKPRARDGRSSRVCTATPKGREALRRWLGPPFPEWIAEVPNDPLRTRVRFLSALPSAGRRAFLAAAEDRLVEQVRQLEDDLRARAVTPFELAMARGAVRLVRARLAWIRGTQRALGDASLRSRPRPR